MVGSLKVLKMLHCRNLRSTVAAKKRNDSNSARKLKESKAARKRNECIVRVESSTRDEFLTKQCIKMEPDADENRCRVCLRDGNIPIYGHSEEEDISIALNTIAGIEVSIDDPYPKHLCQSCNALLQGGILLRKTALNSYKILKRETKAHKKIFESKAIESYPEMEDFDHFDVCNNIEPSFETSLKGVDIKHVDEPILMCKRCDIQFQSVEEYEEHILSADHENKKLPCPICNKIYARKYLRKHMKIHSGEVSHMCDICGKIFKIHSQFYRHRVTHFYDLPHKCTLCPYRGRFSESLKMHMRSHTGERPYQCAQCPSRFISKSNLNKHVLTHSEHTFKCENNSCGKGFYTRRELELHVKVDHTGAKEHKCSICDKPFGYRKHMMKHERTVHKRAKLKSGRTPIYLKVEKQQCEEVMYSKSTK